MAAGEKPAVNAWTPREVAREQRAREERIRRDAARGMEVNLAEGIALVEFAHEFAAAFASSRASP